MSAEYDEMQARNAEAEAERRAKVRAAAGAALVAGNRRMIEREWLAAGYEPMPNADGTLSAPSTFKSVGRWPPPGAKKAAKAGGNAGHD